jgi:hypothetical protein
MRGKQWAIPILLMLLAVSLIGVQAASSGGDAEELPELQCDSNLRVFGDAFDLEAQAGEADPTTTTRSLVDGPVIPGGDAANLDVFVQTSATATVAVTPTSGDVVALVNLETSTADSWRVASWEACG